MQEKSKWVGKRGQKMDTKIKGGVSEGGRKGGLSFTQETWRLIKGKKRNPDFESTMRSTKNRNCKKRGEEYVGERRAGLKKERGRKGGGGKVLIN